MPNAFLDDDAFKAVTDQLGKVAAELSREPRMRREAATRPYRALVNTMVIFLILTIGFYSSSNIICDR